MPKPKFLIDLAERVAATYAQVFIGLLIISGFGADGVTDLSLVKKAAIAALPAALSALKGLIAKGTGNPDSASLAKDV